MQVSVSIVIYNTEESVLERVLQSLAQDPLPKRIVVVDNSPKALAPEILQRFPEVTYDAANDNLGYGRGHNRGIRHFNGKDYAYHLVINPDVYFEGRVLSELMRYMESNPDVASAMPSVLYPDGAQQYLCKLLPTPLDLFARRFMPKEIALKLLGDYDLRFTGYRIEMNLPYLSGCFMFLRRSAFDEIGGFDERYFMYPEDIDLTRRLHSRWRTMFYPGANIYHAHGKASYKSKKMLLIHMWNMIRYFNKWGWIWDRQRSVVNKNALSVIQRDLGISASSHVRSPPTR